MTTHPIKRPSRPLSNQRILLTRPGTDNVELANELRKLGAVALIFPCLQIEPLNPPENVAGDYDAVVYTSRYAVQMDSTDKPQDEGEGGVRHYAIGPTTASAMQEAGLPPATIPEEHSTEGLLSLSGLQSVNGQNWLVVGGESPRMLLQDTLRERGAHVDFLACYRRTCPNYSKKSLERLEKEQITSVVIQSMTALKNLANLLKDLPQHQLWHTELFVPIERYVPIATKLGFCGKVKAVGSAMDDAVIAALRK